MVLVVAVLWVVCASTAPKDSAVKKENRKRDFFMVTMVFLKINLEELALPGRLLIFLFCDYCIGVKRVILDPGCVTICATKIVD